MSYCAAIDYLFGLQKHGIKLGLEKTAEILALTGSPHRQFRCIHIAGTNGKGSVSAMTASILRAHGFRVGLFTSPHLVSFTERIKVDDEEISEAEVIALTDEIRRKIDRAAKSGNRNLSPTFFEFVTAMAFSHFAGRNVDWAVIETGMGGRFDATNVIVPEVSVITRISRDHIEFLGDSLPKIAGEKAGIIKKGVPVVSALQVPEVAEVIAKVADEKSASLSVYGDGFTGIPRSASIKGNIFCYENGSSRIEDLFVPLAGIHQVVNAALAIKAVAIALKRTEPKNNAGASLCACPPLKDARPEAIKAGLASTRLRGRIELVSADPPIIIDGAHNAEAAETLAAFIREYLPDKKIVLVLGIMADKDISGILDTLLPLASEAIFTAPAYSRAASPHLLAGRAASCGFENVIVAPTVRDAVAVARDIQISAPDGKLPFIIITGSFYTAGEAMEALGEKAMLGSLRETV